MKKLAFYSIFLFYLFFPTFLAGQPIEFCGTIGPFQAPTNNPDSIVYDRFGNTYLRSEFANPPQGPFRTLDCVAGYFELQVDEDIPLDIEEVICRVFSDVSSLIIRRQDTDACGDPVQIQPVVIEVLEEIDVPGQPDRLAAATPFYHLITQGNCPAGSFVVQQSNIMRKLNGEPLSSSPDGRLLVDIDPPSPYYYGTDPMGLPANEFDLYSVIFHEVMHLLGFASTIDNNGQPNTTFSIHFSPWDRLLNTTTEYDPGGNSQNVSPLLISDCIHNCYELNQTTFPTIQDFEDAVNSNCTNSNVDIMVGDAGLAPIAGGNSGSFPNDLSHLNQLCGNADYVMQPGLVEGISRRDLTNAEINILCALGYQTATCDGCYMAISNNNGSYNPFEGSCCNLLYTTCVDELISIPISDLLCNDFTNGNSLTITDVYALYPGSNISLQLNGDFIEFSSSDQGYYTRILYTVEGCNCELVTREFSIYVAPCEINCDVSDPCEEIICVNGFEDFIPGEFFLGDPFWITGPNNSPDILECPTNNNSYVFMGNFGTGIEGIAVELEHPIEPLCTLLLSLDVSKQRNLPNSGLVIKGTNNYPCTIVGSRIGSECTNNHTCGSNTHDYVCIDIIDNINSFSPSCPINWETRQITWVNDQNYPVSTLIFHPLDFASGGALTGNFIDNISATLSCTPTIDIVHNTSPQQICSGQELMISHTVCVPAIPGANDTDFDYSIILPNNTTLLDGFLTGSVNIQEGACVDINITILIENSVPVGTVLGFIMDYTASGFCDETNDFYTFDIIVDDISADATFTSSNDCLEVTFTSNHTGDTHSWDFGDGSPLSSDPNPPPHTYMSAGTYVVTHSVTDVCGTTTETESITVESCFSCNCPYTTVVGTPGQEVLFSDLEDAGVLTDGSVDFCVAGTLVFDKPVVFTNSNIAMDAGAELKVNNNALGFNDLLLANTDVFAVCNYMWKGITVEANSLSRYLSSNISDAQYALDVSDAATVIVDNTVFDNNYIGINGVDSHFDLSLQASTFDCTTGLLPAFDGQSPAPGDCGFVGLNLSTDGLYIIGNTNPNVNANTFQNISNGIITEGCNLTLRNSNFFNLLKNNSEPYPLTGYGIYNTGQGQILDQIGNGENGAASFSNCHTGIFTEGMIVNRIEHNNMASMQTGVNVSLLPVKAEIKYNTINATLDGVKVYQANPGSLVKIDHNDINVTGTLKGRGIQINQAGLASGDFRVEWNNITIDGARTKGIQLIANNGTRVTDNTVQLIGAVSQSVGIQMVNPNGFVSCNTVTGTGNFSSQDVGINVWNSSGAIYGCNEVASTHTGVRFSMLSTSPDAFTTTLFSTHEIGLHLTGSAELGEQDGTGNRWEGTYADFGAVYDGADFDLSLFKVDESPTSSFWPNPHSPPFWFQDGNNEAIECKIFTCSEEEIPPPNIHKIDDSIAINGLNLTQYEEEVNWLARQYLYAKLHENSHLMPEGSTMATFYAVESEATVGALYAIQESINDLFIPDTTTLAQLHTRQDHISENMNKLVDIDSILLTASSQDSTQLLASRTVILIETDSLIEQHEQVLDSLTNARITAVPSLLVANAAINPTTIMEQNEVDVNEVLLNTIVSDSTIFEITQVIILNQIANQCPITGGRGVFMARGLLAQLKDTVDYNDEAVLCSPPQNRLSQSTEIKVTESAFKVFPNPAQDQLTIESEEIYDTELEVSISTFIGQALVIDTYPRATNKVILNTTKVPTGVYLLTIRSKNRDVLYSKKIVLLK